MSANPNAITDDGRIRELMLMNLFAVFNERDPERRLKAITANYTEDVIWTDPERTFHGREELNQRAQDLLDALPISCLPPPGRSMCTGRSRPPAVHPADSARAAARYHRLRRSPRLRNDNGSPNPLCGFYRGPLHAGEYRRLTLERLRLLAGHPHVAQSRGVLFVL